MFLMVFMIVNKFCVFLINMWNWFVVIFFKYCILIWLRLIVYILILEVCKIFVGCIILLCVLWVVISMSIFFLLYVGLFWNICFLIYIRVWVVFFCFLCNKFNFLSFWYICVLLYDLLKWKISCWFEVKRVRVILVCEFWILNCLIIFFMYLIMCWKVMDLVWWELLIRNSRLMWVL